jgi:hypothetical protein
VLLAALGHPRRPSADEWLDHHADVHRSEPMRAALVAWFDQLVFERVPYLWRQLGGPATAELEESLIASGAIQALGFRFVGIPATAPALKKT